MSKRIDTLLDSMESKELWQNLSSHLWQVGWEHARLERNALNTIKFSDLYSIITALLHLKQLQMYILYYSMLTQSMSPSNIFLQLWPWTQRPSPPTYPNNKTQNTKRSIKQLNKTETCDKEDHGRRSSMIIRTSVKRAGRNMVTFLSYRPLLLLTSTWTHILTACIW